MITEMSRPSVALLFASLLAGVVGAQQPTAPSPTAPAPTQAPAAGAQIDGRKQLEDARSRLKQTGPTSYRLDAIAIDAKTREVRLPAKVMLKKAPIEYLLTTDTGKTHETVFVTAVAPTALQIALLLANYEPATGGLLASKPPPESGVSWKEEQPKTAGANRIDIQVEWKQGGKTITRPLALMMQDSDVRKAPADLKHWIFNGSYIDERGFVAQSDGSMISAYLDRGAIINSPAKNNWRDDLWISLPDNIPDEGTEVTLIIRPLATP
jgi:hypothetical protein